MAKGKAKVNYLGRSGVVMPQTTPSWSFIYETSTIKHPKYSIGDRVVLPDGREFRYGKSGSALSTVEACHFTATGVIGWTDAIDSVAVGKSEITVPAATHIALTKDVLRGGYIHIHGNATDGADSMFRGIIGNDAVAADVAVKIYLDGPTDVAIDSNSDYEVFENPYAALEWGLGAPLLAKAGVPAAYVDAADKYFWVQTRGPIWCNPQTGVHSNTGAGCMWRGDGSLEDVETALGISTVPDVDTTQYAGHRILGGYTGNGPLFMLQG